MSKSTGDIRLTKKEREVVSDLQNGWSLITSSEHKGAWVSKSKSDKQYHIHNGVFLRLVNKGLICQSPPFWNYELTRIGSTIKIN